MSGWAKALLIIGLAVIGTIAMNVAMWRRMKGALAQRRDWTEADFLQSLAERGCDARVEEAVLDMVRPYYYAGLAPQADDDLQRFLAVDEEEVEDWAEQGFAALDLPEPTRASPERIPRLDTVGDFAAYLDARFHALRADG